MVLEDTVLQASLDDLQRSINYHNTQESLGLKFHGRKKRGAAWSTGDFVITAREIVEDETQLVVASHSGGQSPLGVEAWSRLRELLRKEGKTVTRSHEARMAQLLIEEGLLRPVTNWDRSEWIAPGREVESPPPAGYIVSFTTFHEHGQGVPTSWFMRSLLFYYGVELHNFAPQLNLTGRNLRRRL